MEPTFSWVNPFADVANSAYYVDAVEWMKTEYQEQYIRFGLKVQYYRKLKGLTQEAFADKIGRSWSFVAKVESPTRPFGVSMETLFKIAEVLDVPVSKLFEV